ncbi:MAG: hypothetical protein Q8R01_13520 [Ramlibacter sp.]|nr:hypothetical protein [Ramlibacter sp.]
MDDKTATALVRELQLLNAQIRELPTAIAVALAARDRGIRPEDRQILDVLLPPLRQVVGGATFTLREAAEQAQDDRFQCLRVALEALGREGHTVKRIGKLLSRIEGADLGGGLVLWRRGGPEREGVRWQFVQSPRE